MSFESTFAEISCFNSETGVIIEVYGEDSEHFLVELTTCARLPVDVVYTKMYTTKIVDFQMQQTAKTSVRKLVGIVYSIRLGVRKPFKIQTPFEL